jgi:hypothetical protein
MTVNQLFRELQKLKLDGCGEYQVMISDLTDEPPVPQQIGSVKILKNIKRVFLQSITLEQIVANAMKKQQD